MKTSSCGLGALVVGLAAFGGCAARYGPQSLPQGATVAEITATLGAPTARHSRAGGERLEYARGPYGKHTYMLDLDAQGRLARWEQVLTEPQFNAIRAGMTGDELRQALGRPSEMQRIAHQRRTVWSYRYETPFCKWFQVGVDRQDRVVDTGYGPDPLCDGNLSDGGS
jgi:outer membrane protein assembly factor BamE (lipoprotein component of BamABCDE complex)